MTCVTPHVVIVDHDREHIGRRAIRPQQDEIVEFRILDRDLPLDAVIDRGFTVLRRLQAHDEGAIGFRRRATVAPRATNAKRFFRRLCLGPHRREFVLRQVTAIGMAVCDHVVRHRRMAIRTRELIGRGCIGIEPEPMHSLQDRVDRRLG